MAISISDVSVQAIKLPSICLNFRLWFNGMLSILYANSVLTETTVFSPFNNDMLDGIQYLKQILLWEH